MDLVTTYNTRSGTIIVKRICDITNEYIIGVFSDKFNSYTLTFKTESDAELYCNDILNNLD